MHFASGSTAENCCRCWSEIWINCPSRKMLRELGLQYKWPELCSKGFQTPSLRVGKQQPQVCHLNGNIYQADPLPWVELFEFCASGTKVKFVMSCPSTCPFQSLPVFTEAIRGCSRIAYLGHSRLSTQPLSSRAWRTGVRDLNLHPRSLYEPCPSFLLPHCFLAPSLSRGKEEEAASTLMCAWRYWKLMHVWNQNQHLGRSDFFYLPLHY